MVMRAMWRICCIDTNNRKYVSKGHGMVRQQEGGGQDPKEPTPKCPGGGGRPGPQGTHTKVSWGGGWRDHTTSALQYKRSKSDDNDE